MARRTGPNCAVMYNIINTYTHTQTNTLWEHRWEWHRMTRKTGSDCAVIYNIIIHTLKHTPFGRTYYSIDIEWLG